MADPTGIDNPRDGDTATCRACGSRIEFEADAPGSPYGLWLTQGTDRDACPADDPAWHDPQPGTLVPRGRHEGRVVTYHGPAAEACVAGSVDGYHGRPSHAHEHVGVARAVYEAQYAQYARTGPDHTQQLAIL